MNYLTELIEGIKVFHITEAQKEYKIPVGLGNI